MHVVRHAGVLGRSSYEGSLGSYHSRYVDVDLLLDGYRESVLLTSQKGFAHMKNSFSESSHLLTKDFIGLLIWMVAFIPLLLVAPERLQIPFGISFVLFAGSCIGLLVWWVMKAPKQPFPNHTDAM